MTELHEVAGGRVEPESVQISFRKIFGGAQGDSWSVTASGPIDFEAREASPRRRRIRLRLPRAGSRRRARVLRASRDQGACIHALVHSTTPCGCAATSRTCIRRASAEPDGPKRAEMLTFVVAGAGFTGVELAGELMDQRRVLCRRLPHRRARSPHRRHRGAGRHHPQPSRRSSRRSAQSVPGAPRGGVHASLPDHRRRDGQGPAGGGTVASATRTFVWTCGIQGCEFAAQPRRSRRASAPTGSAASPRRRGPAASRTAPSRGTATSRASGDGSSSTSTCSQPGLLQRVRRRRRGLVPGGQARHPADRGNRRADRRRPPRTTSSPRSRAAR